MNEDFELLLESLHALSPWELEQLRDEAQNLLNLQIYDSDNSETYVEQDETNYTLTVPGIDFDYE